MFSLPLIAAAREAGPSSATPPTASTSGAVRSATSVPLPPQTPLTRRPRAAAASPSQRHQPHALQPQHRDIPNSSNASGPLSALPSNASAPLPAPPSNASAPLPAPPLVNASWAVAAAEGRSGEPQRLAAGAETSNLRPVVIVHGLLSSRRLDNGMSTLLSRWVGEALPGVYIRLAEVGTSRLDGVVMHDFLHSFMPNSAKATEDYVAQASSLFISLDEQVRQLCDQLRRDHRLARGFNLVAHSQGALVARGFIERCGVPRVHNFISLAGPHAGVFGMPFYAGEPGSFQGTATAVLHALASSRLYSPGLQSRLSFAQYWKNPFNMSAYRNASGFLRDINNEGSGGRNETYVTRLASLHTLLLVGFERDGILVPRESATFGFYEEGSSTTILPLRRSALYTHDLLGLRLLVERGALREAWANCTHSEPPHSLFVEQMLPLLNDTLPDEPLVQQTAERLSHAWSSLAEGTMQRLLSAGEWLGMRARLALAAS